MNNININGCNIAYLELGSGRKKIIFLHGNNEDHTVFGKMMNKFDPSQYTAYLIDTRAHGESDFKGSITIEQFADDVLEFIDKLNLGKVDIIGYSDGANIAMVMAYKKPEIIEKMVLLSGNFNPKAIIPQERMRIWIKYFFSCFGRLFKEIRRINKLQKLMLVNYGIGKEELAKIDVPTLVIGAEFDVIDHSHTELIANTLQNGIAIFTPKTTHYNLVENEHTATEIQKFLW